MDMGAYLLACVCSTEDPDDGNLDRRFLLPSIMVSSDFRVKMGGYSLIMVNTVETHAKEFHSD